MFFLCAIDIFSKNAWVVPLKEKKGIIIANAFQIILDKTNRKPKKTCVVDFTKDQLIHGGRIMI